MRGDGSKGLPAINRPPQCHPLSIRATVVDTGRTLGGVRDFRHGQKSCMRVEEVLGTVRAGLVCRAVLRIETGIIIGDLRIR